MGRKDNVFDVLCDGTDRAEWLDLRRQGIGASDAAGVLGVGRGNWSSPPSVFADKVLEPEPETDKKEWLVWGHKLEPLIIEAFEEETGRPCTRDGQLLRSVEYPFMQCTLDARQHLASQKGWGVLEVKNSRLMMNDIPQDYWIQIQHQFAVTGAKFGSFAVLIMGSQFFWSDVERDDEFIEQTLIPECRKFWDVVLNRGPTPASDATEATKKALSRLYPNDQGGTVILDGGFIDRDLRRQDIQQQIKDLQEEKQGIDSMVRREIGDNSFAVLPNGRQYSWKANKNGVRTLRAPPSEVE